MKILLIGLGRWGKNHLRVLSEICDEVYVADLDRKQWNGLLISQDHFSSNYRDFLDKVDAVDVVTPTDSHFDICWNCFEKGKDVFVEKPISLASWEAKEMIRQSEKYDLIFQVGHIYRYHLASLLIKEIIEGGKLGIIKYAYGHFTGFKRPRMDVGVTQTDAIHYFDLFNYLFSELPNAVTAITRNYLGLPLDDLSTSILEYGDKTVLIEVGYLLPEERKDIAIIGDRGTLRCDFQKNFIVFHNNFYEIQEDVCVAVKNDAEEIPVNFFEEPLKVELRAFLNSVKNHSKPLSDGQSGYEALRVVEACYESSQKRKGVEIKW